MATRRTNITSSTETARIINPSSSSSSSSTKDQQQPSDVTPAVPKSIIFKLLAFTAAMVLAPISTYFLTVNSLFKGNSSYAGGLAALVANVVLIAYVIVAYKDDETERIEEEARAKKSD